MEQTHASASPPKIDIPVTGGNKLPMRDADLSYNNISGAALKSLTFRRPQNYFDWRQLRRIGVWIADGRNQFEWLFA